MRPSPIRFQFDEVKATAAAAILLRLGGGRMKYLHLIKLLYMVERESLRRYGRPVIGDDYVAMKHGPVLSITYNLIKEDHPGRDFWLRHIRRVPKAYEVELVRDPGTGPLSDAEVAIIEGVFRRYGRANQWVLRDLTHKFPEWKDPGDSCHKIHPEGILRALKKSEEEIERISQEAAERMYFHELFRVERA
ncbi:MAG: SocA family protein [Planctomycetes bacterium]|nr:SocA family protein [Planctomycetota bacterium]